MTETTPAKPAARWKSVAAHGCALLTAAALAGCSNFGGRRYSYTCPSATTVPDLQSLVTIVPGANGAHIQSSGRIDSVTTTCDRESDNGIVSHLSIEFTALRTTPAVKDLALPYFVAMADANGNILGKQQYTIPIRFDPEAPVARRGDSVTVHIPLKNPLLGNVYTLVVGFQLTKSQLQYNRAHLQ